jgi:hypothetical protein
VLRARARWQSRAEIFLKNRALTIHLDDISCAAESNKQQQFSRRSGFGTLYHAGAPLKRCGMRRRAVSHAKFVALWRATLVRGRCAGHAPLS